LYLLFLQLILTDASAAALSEDQKEEIKAITSSIQAAGRYPSVTLLIDKGGATLYSASQGIANLEHGIDASADSVYAMGSITKSFTALAILQLVERKMISLDRPLSTYLPDYQGPARNVSVRRLLDHTSGIPNYTGIPGLNEQLRRAAYTREQMVDTFENLPLEFTPGDKFSYTNSGFYLLGLIIESVTGMDYYDALEHQIFQPLGMTRTFSGDDTEIIPGRVAGYSVDENGFINAPPWSHLVPFAAGSLVTTASDLVKYRRGVFHSSHISPELQDMLLHTNVMNDGTPNLYSQGALIISDFNGHTKYSHSGDIWGFAANHAFYPEDDLTIVVLTNHQAEAPSVVSLEQKIARIVFGIPQPEILDLTLGQKEAARIQGDYDLHPFIFGPSRYGFVAREGKIYLKFGGMDAPGPMLPLFSQGDGRFVAAFDDERQFEFDAETSPAGSFSSNTRDGVFYATRVTD
jgi:CubicO group peptidase (beta-lactamase class C family)